MDVDKTELPDLGNHVVTPTVNRRIGRPSRQRQRPRSTSTEIRRSVRMRGRSSGGSAERSPNALVTASNQSTTQQSQNQTTH